MRTIAWYLVGSFLSHLSMILSVRNMETTFAWPLERQLVSWMKINIYIYYILYSYLPTINGHYQKQLAKDNVINHTFVMVLYIHHAMTCLVTVSGCCFQTKLYIRRIKYKIIQLNLLSVKYYSEFKLASLKTPNIRKLWSKIIALKIRIWYQIATIYMGLNQYNLICCV